MIRTSVFAMLGIAFLSQAALADAAPPTTVKQLSEHLYYINAGGSPTNNLLYIDEKDSLLVDTTYEKPGMRLATELKKAVAGLLKGRKLGYIVNTHMHDDHAQGNAVLASLGATIVAQSNCAQGIKNGYFLSDARFDPIVQAFGLVVDFPPAPKESIPTLTYDKFYELRFKDETIRLVHPQGAHTDGDTIVYFNNANVVAMGDLYFSSAMPIIDRDAHGSLDGMIAAAERTVSTIDDKTVVVPGHGPLADRNGLSKFAGMLKSARGTIAELAKTQSEDQIVTSRALQALEAEWGGFGPLGVDLFTRMAYRSIKASRR